MVVRGVGSVLGGIGALGGCVTIVAAGVVMGLVVWSGEAQAAGRLEGAPGTGAVQAGPMQVEPTPDPIPGSETSPDGDGTYVVQPGDWVALIADQQGVTVNEIARLNPEVQPPDYLIIPGQVLVLREAVVAVESVPPAPAPAADVSTEEVAEPSVVTPSMDPVATPDAVVAPAVTPAADSGEGTGSGIAAAVEPVADDDNGLAIDVVIALGGVATGLVLGLGGSWVRRWKRGY